MGLNADTEKQQRIARMRNRRDRMTPRRKHSAVSQVVELSECIREHRALGYSWDQIAELLADEGIFLTPGTLRNCMRLLEKAASALARDGVAEPSDAALLEKYRELRRGERRASPVNRKRNELTATPNRNLGFGSARLAVTQTPRGEL